MKKTLLSWSSGKDSAWTLHRLRADPRYEVVGLLTTINSAADRVAMHAVRTTLLRAQAAAAGLPLWEVLIPSPCSNEEYESAMRDVITRAQREGIECMAFGDLFLEDVRRYREEKLAGTGIAPVFPLFGSDTRALAEEMIAGGLRARITCVDPRAISGDFAGREFDRALLAGLLPDADPCGSAASSTPSATRARCSRGRSTSRREHAWSAMVSCSAISYSDAMHRALCALLIVVSSAGCTMLRRDSCSRVRTFEQFNLTRLPTAEERAAAARLPPNVAAAVQRHVDFPFQLGAVRRDGRYLLLHTRNLGAFDGDRFLVYSEELDCIVGEFAWWTQG